MYNFVDKSVSCCVILYIHHFLESRHMINRSIRFIALFSLVFLLSACEENLAPELTRGFVPYTMERTAGPGIAYVRARLLQERGPNLTPSAAQTPLEGPISAPAPIPEEPILSSDDIFADDLFKGVQVK